MQIFLKKLYSLLTKTQEEKFEDVFLTKTANKQITLSQRKGKVGTKIELTSQG